MEKTTGAALIAAERQRQIEKEGYTVDHDAEHDLAEIAFAAIAYLKFHTGCSRNVAVGDWPWEEGYFKPTADDPVRNLVKAGALIAAEIDRLQRI